MKRFKVYRVGDTIIGQKFYGGKRSYGIIDVLSHLPFCKETGLTKKEAEMKTKRLNKEIGWKLSRWDKLFHNEKEVKKLKRIGV